MRLPSLLALAGLTAAAPAARPADPPSPAAQAAAVQEHMRKLIDAAEPSVVALVVSHHPGYPLPPSPTDRARGVLGGYEPRQPFQGRGALRPDRDRLDLSDVRNIPDHNYGTGVVVDEAGLILTNYHLIENATKVYVRVSGGTGAYADIVAADSRSDLAVLRLLPRGNAPARLTPARAADVRVADELGGRKANVFRGMWVIAVAHPFAAGFADGTPSASWGILSNVRRRVPGYGNEEQRTGHLYQYGSLLQTDARLNLGSSGGALLNLDGELIGLTSSVAAVTGSEAGGGYAIPMTANYRRIVEALKAGREVEYGFLGVTPGSISTDPPGLSVNGVSPFSPAALAGLQPYEIIQEINGVPVREPDDLFLNIGAALAGTRVTLKVAGRGTSREVEVTLAKFLHNHPFIASVRPPAVHGLRVEYSSILSQQVLGGRGFGNELRHIGVIVRELEPNTPAEAAFKQLGGNDPTRWMITAVNGTPVRTPDEFYKAVGPGKRPVRLTVVAPTTPGDAGRTVTLP